MRTMLPLLLFAALSIGLSQEAPEIEIVESVPLETVLDNPEIRNAREVWLEMINRAKQTLDIEQFYIADKPGGPLEGVLAAIVAAGKRGVSVRIIADARMARTYPEPLGALGREQNIAVRVIDYGKLAGGVQHAKFFIVDRGETFLGSQNFDWRALEQIHELGVRIRQHEAAGIYGEVFDLDWKLAETNDRALIASLLIPRRAPTPLRFIRSGNDTVTFWPTMSPKGLIADSTLWDERNIVDLIDEARSDIYCQVLTYSPIARDRSYYAVLNDALKRAASRGVRVHMIVADWSKDHPTVDSLKSLSRTANIEVKFSAIPDWSGGYISFARVEHCKYLVVDSSACWLGTSNWEKSYFYSTRNLGVVIRNTPIASTLRKVFLKGWNGPYTERITPEANYTPRMHSER